MTGRDIQPRQKRQYGLSLIELMIGMLLGLVVVAAAFNIYNGSTRSTRFTQGLQAMQENGRYGVSTLKRGLRLSGYSPSGKLEPLAIELSGNNFITVRQTQPFDCNGASTAPTGGVAVNTYRFDGDSDNDGAPDQITCRGNQAAATAMPIIDGVDGFRLLYGVGTANASGRVVPQRYVPWSASLDADTIGAVRFAMLVTSGEQIRSRAIGESHVLLDTMVTRNDRIARDVFGGTVMIRN